ncbi:Anaphase promoting complex subunit 7 [Branchiostoma belcheri]|nr:Anaphase promoting complex subunit 7 [Branchiostoma belcheri]
MKVKILQIKQKYEEAIELLRSQLVNQSLCVLHQLLGDCLSAVSDYQEALDQYSIALSIDPTDQKSLEGLQRIEKNGNNLEANTFLRASLRKVSDRHRNVSSVSRPNADVVPPEAVKLALERTHHLTITAL